MGLKNTEWPLIEKVLANSRNFYLCNGTMQCGLEDFFYSFTGLIKYTKIYLDVLMCEDSKAKTRIGINFVNFRMGKQVN